MTTSPPDAHAWARRAGGGDGPPEVHEAVLETPDGRRMTLVAASETAIIATAARIDSYVQQLRPLDPAEEPQDDFLPAVLDHAVGRLEALVRGHDALDVMAMLRQYMIPPDLALWSESGSSLRDSWAAAEVVALVLLGLGLPERDPSLQARTASIIPQLVDNAAAVVHLASVNGIVRYSQRRVAESAVDGMNAMAWRLSSHETSVRGRQYPLVAADINDAVLRTSRTDATFRDQFGFTLDDILAVREALVELVGQSHHHAYERLAVAAQTGGPPDAETVAAITAIFETPSRLALVTPEQISARAALDRDVSSRILELFSIRPDGRPPVSLVRDFINGRNPMAGTAMLHDPARGYLPLPGAMALDEIRRTCEAPIKGTKSWTRYGRARDQAVERVAADTLAALLTGQAAAHRNLRYRDSADGHDLSHGSTSHPNAPVTEADCLLVLDGVALCVEAKAGDLRPRTRQGGVAQLEGDLGKTVKDAAEQADRLRQLIERNHGLWRDTGEWLDLANVDEIHSIVVCLDDLGPLALCTSELVRAGSCLKRIFPGWSACTTSLCSSMFSADPNTSSPTCGGGPTGTVRSGSREATSSTC